VKATVTADGQGAFHHVVDQVVAREGGGIVLARDATGATTSGLLQAFVPAPPAPH
jgi:hypothetical protein